MAPALAQTRRSQQTEAAADRSREQTPRFCATCMRAAAARPSPALTLPRPPLAPPHARAARARHAVRTLQLRDTPMNVALRDIVPDIKLLARHGLTALLLEGTQLDGDLSSFAEAAPALANLTALSLGANCEGHAGRGEWFRACSRARALRLRVGAVGERGEQRQLSTYTHARAAMPSQGSPVPSPRSWGG